MTGQLRTSRAFGLAAALLSVASAQRAAADYLLTATGNFESSSTYSEGFDGTTYVDPHLPSLYDAARLEGGSFVATYRFSTPTPPASGDFATHNFDSLAGLTYSLLDPDGAVVHVGSNPSAAFAFVFNNHADFGDEISLIAFVNDASGLVTPPALYQPAPDLYAQQSHLRFIGDVMGGSDFIPNLALPTEAATYLGFPTKTFTAAMTFNDGDVFGLEGGPYQYVESHVSYAITNVTVTAVPEPSSLAICGIGLCFAAAVRRRKRSITRLGLSGVALLAVLGGDTSPVQATNYWKNSVVTGNWSTGNNWASSSGGVDNAGTPISTEAVNIVFADGTARTVTYDFASPSLGILSIDLTGPGATPAALSMPNTIYNLTANGIIVGGYSGAALTNGRGALNQSGGTTTTNANQDLILAYGAGSTGAYTLSGGALVNNLDEYIGFSGTGTFNHSGGSNTINASASGFFSVGHNASSTGNYYLSGTGVLSANTHEYIGNSGTGVFTQSGGTNTISGLKSLFVGNNANSTGTYTLSGTGALSVSSEEYIGYAGTGTFTQTGGFHTASDRIHIGNVAGALGTYTLSGGGLSVGGNVYIGESAAGNMSQTGGTFNQSGGSNSIASGKILYLGYNANSTGTYTLSAGSLSTGLFEYVGYSGTGTFTHSGGTNSASSIYVGALSGSTGTYSLIGTGALSTSSNLVLGSSGGTGIFNQSGGTNTIGGYLLVGETSTGTYTLSGGSLSCTTEGLGIFNSTSTFIQTGGTNTISDVLSIGADASTSIFTLSGGSTTVGGITTVGTGNFTNSVVSSLTVSGTGALTMNNTLKVFNRPGNSVNLSGGTINAVGLNLNGAPALFNWTSGTLNMTTSVTWDSAAASTSTSAAFGAARSLVSGQILTITGNETLGGAGAFALTLDAGSVHNATGTVTVATNGTLTVNAGSTLSAPTITQAGGTVNGTLQNQTTFTYQSGQFNGRLVNHGAVSFGPSFVVGNGVENDVALTVAAGQTLTTNGTGLDNHSFFTVAAGGNLVATTVINHSEFTADGSATATTFSNSALLHGVGQVTGAVTNTASGDVRVATGERLRFAGSSFTNQGLVEVIGNATSPAEIEFYSPVTNASSTGLITGRNNVLRFNGGLTNEGSLAISIGTSDVFGDISNTATGKIVVSGGAGTTFYDDIVQNGTFRVTKVGSTTSVAVVFGAFSGSGGSTGGGDIFFEGDLRPGSSPARVVYKNNVSFGSSTLLQVELGGTSLGTQYDQVHVDGELALGGTLKVEFIDSGAGLFAPAAGDSFDILDWEALSGTFSTIQLPTLAGALAWNTSQLYTTGVLSVVAPGPPGDYNNNVVDSADYVVWRKFNNTMTTLPNDSTPGTSPADYTVWRSHFGQPPASGLGADGSVSVPEPATALMLIVGILPLLVRRQARVS